MVSGFQGLQGQGKGVTTSRCGISFWQDENVLELEMVTVAHPCEYAKDSVDLKIVKCRVCVVVNLTCQLE